MTVDYRTVCLWLLANYPVVIIGLIFGGIVTVMLYARTFQVVRRRAVIPMDDEPFMDDGPEPKQVAALFAKSAGNVPDAKPDAALFLQPPNSPDGHLHECKLNAYSEGYGVTIRLGDLLTLLNIAPRDMMRREVDGSSPLATEAFVRRIVAEELAKQAAPVNSGALFEPHGTRPVIGDVVFWAGAYRDVTNCESPEYVECADGAKIKHWAFTVHEPKFAGGLPRIVRRISPAPDVVKLLEIDAPALTVQRHPNGDCTIQVQGPRNRCFDLVAYDIFEMPNGRTIHAQQQRRNHKG